MFKVVKKGYVWKHCKSSTLWAISYRGDDWLMIEGIGQFNNGERRRLSINNFLKKYKFDKIYETLYGKYDFKDSNI